MPATLFPYFQKLLILYFVIGMHVILATPGGSGLYLSFNIIGWMFAVAFIALGLWQITLNKRLYYSKFQLWALLGFSLLCLPLFYGSEFSDRAIPRVLGLAGGLLFWFILSQFYFSHVQQHKRFKTKKNDAKTLLKRLKFWSAKKSNSGLLLYILYAVAIEAIFGLIQTLVLSHGDWSGYIPGKSRPHGVFLQPNVMASFMATGLAIALYLSVNLRYLRHKTINQAVIFFVLASSSFLLILLQSRSGHLSSLLVLILLGSYVYKHNKKQFLRVISTIFTAVLLAMCFLWLSGDGIHHRKADSYQNPGARPNTYIVTAEMILRNPLQGVGYGFYERAFLDTYNDMVLTRPELLPVQHRMAHPHNEVLLWVSEGGLAPLLGLLCFAVGYIVVWRKIPPIKAWAILGLVTPLLLHSQLEFPFYISLSHWLIFIALIWLAELHSKAPYYSIRCYPTFFIRSMALLIAFIFMPFLATTLHTAQIIVNYQQSKEGKLESFKNIINPIGWQRLLDKYIYGNILYAGLKNKDTKALALYINWGLERIKYKPSALVYSNILLSYKLLGEQEKYKELYAEASNTYPLYTQWGTHYQQHKDEPNDSKMK